MFKTTLAYENWESKYRYGDETPVQTWERVARTLAAVEKKPEDWYDKFLKTIVKFNEDKQPIGLKCTPGGRITANIGTKFKGATLLNCFISGPVSGATIKYTRKTIDGFISYPVEINTPESPDDLVNIFLSIMEQAKTLASEGGYGMNFDWIRPRGSLIKGTGIKHPGVVAYMKVWDAVAECIVKGDKDGYSDKLRNYLKSEEAVVEIKDTLKKMTRKGAMLAALSVSHPDIEEFIRAKQQSGVLTKFNISVLIDNAFISAVESDDFYEQKFNGVVIKRVKARALYDLIMESTYNRAEPGVLFYDNLQTNNPISYLGNLNCANPSLRKGTRIVTDSGLEEIQNLENKKFKIKNLNGTWEDAECFLSGKNKTLYKISLSNNNEVYCTEEHKWPVLTVGGGWAKQYTRNLRSGDVLPFPSAVNNYLNYNDELTRDEGFMLGWLYGDGWIHTDNQRHEYGFMFNRKERYIAKKVLDIVNTLKPDKSSINNDRDGNFVFQISSEVFHTLMVSKYGVISKEEGFPRCIWESNLNFIHGFLDGLLSSDGFVSQPVMKRLSLTTSKEKMAYDYCDLLGFLGVKTTKYKRSTKKVIFPNKKNYNKEYTRFDIHTHGRNVLDLGNDFYLTHIDKQKRLKNIINTCSNFNKIDFNRVRIVSVEKTELQEDVWDIRVFDDTHCFRISSAITGNCGEVGGNPLLTTVCLLGSPNLTQYVDIINGVPTFNWDEYIEDVKTFSRMLDNVCDLSNAPLPSYEWAIKNIRQFGMGINGLGSTLMMLGIKYNSPEAIAFTKKICSLKENLTWQTSALLAKEKGVFPAYNKEKFESTAYFKSDRITEETKALMRKYGVRNGKTTTCPPAGTTAIICDNTSNGIEPVYKLDYERKAIVSSWPTGLTAENVKSVLEYHKKKDFEYWEGEFDGKKYYYEPHNRGLCEVTVVRDYGYQWLLDNFPNKDHSDYLVTTKDLTVEDHMAIQETLQYYNNQSTSKTINLPNKYPFADFKKLYIEGCKRGLVGLTTYREGSMESVLSSIETAIENKEIIKRDIKLPSEFINGPTKVIKREGMKFYIHFSYLPEDTKMTHPVCIWIYTNSEEKGASVICNKASRELAKLSLKCGIEQKLVVEAIEKCKNDYPHNRLGRMISLCLRHNIPREDILVTLKGIEEDRISSVLTAVKKFIGETIKDGTVLKGIKCPNCGGDNMVMQAGCYSCNDCHSIGCGS